ncbi:MFS transporter [Dactylosporangium darangshiense]|uniref:Major facilitator superfamily (MFS) profile domain-containing protein n=1 Tax=Dactylosporangium darangshiense TaxID=579108 RepID=A0ABP8CYF1_9ACTN
MTLTAPAKSRAVGLALVPLGLMFLAVGLSTALVFPFLSLFLSTDVHAGPLGVTVFLAASPLAGVVATTLVGRLSDRLPIRRWILVGAALAGVVGTLATAFVREYWVLLASPSPPRPPRARCSRRRSPTPGRSSSATVPRTRPSASARCAPCSPWRGSPARRSAR